MSTHSPTVYGFSTGGAWFDTLGGGGVTSSITSVGMIFDSLSANVLITSASISITPTSVGAGSVALRMIPVGNPTDWGDSNLPHASGGALGDALQDDLFPLTTDEPFGWTLDTVSSYSVGSPVTFSWNDDATFATQANGLQDTFATLYRGNTWGQKFAFTLYSASGSQFVWGVPTLTLTTLPIDTGIDGVVGNSRADRCPICARRSLRETWIMSGYLKRLVCPDCWDPKDPDENRRPIRAEDRLGINPEG
jgi:hypothetical protein